MKSILPWRILILVALAIILPRTIFAQTVQTNYYWQTIAQSLTNPQGVGVDSSGDIFIANTSDNTILEVEPSGTNWVDDGVIAGQSGVSGTNDGVGTLAAFNNPFGIAVENSTTLFVADSQNNAIREVYFDGTNWNVTTIAGTCDPSITGFLDGTNQLAQFAGPNGIAVDQHGNIFVADTVAATIREISPSGTNWVTTTIAGTGGIIGNDDGTNGDASFFNPYGLAVDSSDDVFVADTINDEIREIRHIGTNWVTTTLAGQQYNTGFSDGKNTAALFNEPGSIAVDGLNNLYVADTYNNAIRKMTRSGTNWITRTIGGLSQGGGPSNGGLNDGTNIVAQFNGPQGIASDSDGNIYVGDTANNAIRLGYVYPPALNIDLEPNLATVSYYFLLGTNLNFTLQAATNLPNAVWLKVTNQWQLTPSNVAYVSLAVTNKVPRRFFRLQLR